MLYINLITRCYSS